MKFVHFILKTIFRSLVGSKSRIFSIWGMRRSGNHACIHWLANALAEKNIRWKEGQGHHFMFSDDGTVAFINESNLLATVPFFFGLRKNITRIRKAQFLLISFEDLHPSEYKNWRDLGNEAILVRRNVLDIMASRFHNLNQKARSGIGWERQSLDASFFASVELFLMESEAPNHHHWQFEDWKSSPDDRVQFLKTLGLHFDEVPPVSHIGGGSSFTGTRERKVEAGSRLERVEPEDAWSMFLMDILSHRPHLLSPESETAVRSFLEKAVQ